MIMTTIWYEHKSEQKCWLSCSSRAIKYRCSRVGFIGGRMLEFGINSLENVCKIPKYVSFVQQKANDAHLIPAFIASVCLLFNDFACFSHTFVSVRFIHVIVIIRRIATARIVCLFVFGWDCRISMGFPSATADILQRDLTSLRVAKRKQPEAEYIDQQLA